MIEVAAGVRSPATSDVDPEALRVVLLGHGRCDTDQNQAEGQEPRHGDTGSWHEHARAPSYCRTRCRGGVTENPRGETIEPKQTIGPRAVCKGPAAANRCPDSSCERAHPMVRRSLARARLRIDQRRP